MPEPGGHSARSLPRRSLRFVGVASIVFAGLGFWCNATTFFTFAKYPADANEPHFLHAFYAMSAICVACYLVLLAVGIQSIRLKLSAVRLLCGLMVFEVIYLFGVTTLWTVPSIGQSVTFATVVANGGLVAQFLTLFPLWGALLARWAKKQMEAGPLASTIVLFPDEEIDRTSDWAWAAVRSIAVFLLSGLAIALAWGRLSPGTFPPGYATCSIPALLGVANGVASVRIRRKKRRKAIERRRAGRLRAGLCPRCEYNLTGNVSGRCPECGEPVRSERGHGPEP